MYPNATQAVHAAPSVLTGRLTRMLVAAIAACIASLALFGSPAMAADESLAKGPAPVYECSAMQQVKGSPDEQIQTCVTVKTHDSGTTGELAGKTTTTITKVCKYILGVQVSCIETTVTVITDRVATPSDEAVETGGR